MNVTRKVFSREGFLTLLLLSVGGVASVAYAIPIVAFVLSPLIKQEPKVWRDVGGDSSFKLGETVQVNFKYADQFNSSWAGSTQYPRHGYASSGRENTSPLPTIARTWDARCTG